MTSLTKSFQVVLLFLMMRKRKLLEVKAALYKEVVKKILDEYGFKINEKI